MSYKRKEEIENLIEEMKQVNIFNGTFDAKNGSWEFMHGVACVMAYLAEQVSEEYAIEFNEEFTNNFVTSVDKANEKRYNKSVKRGRYYE